MCRSGLQLGLRVCRGVAADLFHFEGDRGWIGGGGGRGDLRADAECLFPRAALQQNKEGVCVAVDHACAPLWVTLHHSDGILQRFSPGLQSKWRQSANHTLSSHLRRDSDVWLSASESAPPHHIQCSQGTLGTFTRSSVESSSTRTASLWPLSYTLVCS